MREPDRFLVFGRPVLGPEERRAVAGCVEDYWIGTGPRVEEFERRFAAYKSRADQDAEFGPVHAVAVNSCTSAMQLTLLAMGVGSGDDVVLAAMTFCSTANLVEHIGARPVLADCDPGTMNITLETLRRAVTDRTRAVIVVHMCGRCADMDPILAFCRERSIGVIEDCAHAVESEYRGRPAGLLGDAGCFSFYANKNMTTGEGGMMVTRDADLAGRVRTLANHGMTANAWRRYNHEGWRHYSVIAAGMKANMPDLLAALGLVQMDRLEAGAGRRREIFDAYQSDLAGLPCALPLPEEAGGVHARHLYTVLLDLDRLRVDRDRVLEAMTAEGIGVGVHYMPVHWHPYYRERFEWGGYPGAERVGLSTMSLPISGAMTGEDQQDVCRALRKVFAHFSRDGV